MILNVLSEQARIGWRYKELEPITGLSARFWRREVREGRIAAVKFDNAVMILRADLEEYLASRRRKNEAQTQGESFAATT